MRVAHQGLDEGLLDVLQRVAQRRGLRPEHLEGSHAPEVVVLGPRLDEPLRTAQAVGKRNAAATFLLIVEPERLNAMRQAVRVTPFLGASVQCVSAEDEQLPTHMARALEGAARRRRNQAMVAFAQASLGAASPGAAGQVLDRLLDKAPVGVALLSADGRVVAWNQAAMRITGTTERGAIGSGLAHALRALDPGQVQRALEGAAADAIEVAPDHRHRFVEVTATRVPLGTEDGTLVIVQDVTERVRGAQELQDTLRTLERRVEERTRDLTALVAHLREEVEQRRLAEIRLEEAQRLARLGSWHVEPASGLVVLSATMRHLLGVPGGMVAQEAFLDRIHPDDRQAVAMGFDLLLREGRTLRLDVAVVRPDGEVRRVDLLGRVLDSGAGHRTVGGTALDITERRRLEEERVKAVERLKEIERLRAINRFKTQFMNTVAHELFTPLTPIQIQLHILRAHPEDLRPDQARALEIVGRNFTRLKALVEDVLDAVRAQSGHLPMRKQPTDLRTLVDQCVETFGSLARQRGIELRHDRGGACQVEVDPHRISQVLYNLVSNALKFTQAGGTVRIRLHREDGHCAIRIMDTGIGMTREQMERAFQPFAQVHEKPTTVEGTGLGLHISKQIVELHGGTIALSSDGPGLGTTFEIRLPAAAAKQVGEAAAPRQETA